MKSPFLGTVLLSCSTAAWAATFTVTTTADGGPGSLRQAILDANGTPGLDTIAFNIPGAGVHTITPTTSLPLLADPVIIDGYTQPGSSPNTDPVVTNAVLLIELDGSVAGETGLYFDQASPPATNSVVQGLVLNRWVWALYADDFGKLTVRGCFLGTDPAGTADLGNGVGINFDADAIVVGGTSPADRNLLSGNIYGIAGFASSVLIQGNLVGTDRTGAQRIANSDGIRAGGPAVVIGGSAAGAGNVISGNEFQGGSSGVVLVSSNAVVQGNRIGTTADGTGALGNGVGIAIDFVSDNTIGGTGAGEANEIAFNASVGVSVAGVNNSVRGNSIHDNARLGIALVFGTFDNTKPQFNDPEDADDGGNNGQNFPIITSVTTLAPQGTGTRIQGKLNSTPSTTFDLDFYANAGCATFPREFLEGETYLGSDQVTTDASGNATIDVTLSAVIQPGQKISATATDPSGNTSEFSSRVLFSIDPPSGPAVGGTAITVSGTDFADPTTMTIGGLATSVSFVDDHTLNTTSPALDPGTVNDVVATTSDGTVGTLMKGWVADFLDVDVNGNQLFYQYVTTLVSNAITVGIGNGLYGVDEPTKRQQMAVFLLKAKHGLCYTPPPCNGDFLDVPCTPGVGFADWIEALADEGITGGCAGGNYCPNDPVKRKQMAVFLLKAKHGSTYAPPPCDGDFDDVPCTPGMGFPDWIEQLAAEGITGGCSHTPPLYCPENANTRGQMAVFITLTFNLQ